jgi:transposase
MSCCPALGAAACKSSNPLSVSGAATWSLGLQGDRFAHVPDDQMSTGVPNPYEPRGEPDDRFRETGSHGTGDLFVDTSFVSRQTRNGIMARWRHAVELALTDEEIEGLGAIARSRSEPARRVERARMLLAYRENPSFFAVGQRLAVHHQTVQRCVERAVAYGPLAALDDRPRPGKEPTITPEAKAWLVSLACDKAKEHGYPHELWTTRLLARHARENAPAAGHECLANLAQGTVCKILAQEEIKPHKVRYYLEQRDTEFEQKMAEVLCVYREVQVLKKAKSKEADKPVAIVSYDEKPGIQAIATTGPDLPLESGIHATFARDHEYKRHGTVSLLAGIDLLTGKIHALVRDRHRSREFIDFLKLVDAAYPASTAIKLILDNHSAHISRETRTWLATRPTGRFEFTFTPKHGSWLNLIEGFFSKFARSVLRHIRVESKQELRERIMAGINDVNRRPVIHTWSCTLAEAA